LPRALKSAIHSLRGGPKSISSTLQTAIHPCLIMARFWNNWQRCDRTPTFALPSALPSETAVEDPAVVDPVLPSEDPMILDQTPDAASDGLPTDIPISADV
ncbi:hypothetical protein B0H17DRAFT_1152604, partial [Mycena rosella]